MTIPSLSSLFAPSLSPAPSSSHPYRMPEPPEDDRRGAEAVDTRGRPLALVSAKVKASAAAGLARIVLEQTFENPYEETLRISYRMPLPADGAVSGYAFDLGDRTVTGVVERKARARERFEQALVEGRTAALLDQERADVFTQEIGNVPGRATIVARITVDVRLAWLPEGEWELRMPTVIGPRYLGTGTTADDARAVKVQVDPNGISARFQLELVVKDEIEGDGRPTSPSHAITTTADGLTVLRDTAGARLDRDVVLRWKVARPEASATLVVSRPKDGPHAHHAYGLVSIVPPEPRSATAVPRDLIVLLDTSGSMSGAPLEQGKRVVAQILAALGPGDTLELIEFSSAPRRFAAAPMAATEDAKKKALAWLSKLQAGGATEMEAAVVEALSAIRRGAQRQVVLVTDGYIGGEHQLVMRLHENLPPSCRMHVVGVGSGVNRALSTAIARAGRGAEVLVGLTEDAERAAKRLVDRTRSPILTEVTIEGDALVEHAPEHVPDVFAGAPVLAALKLRPEGGTLVVRGNLATGAWQKTIHVPRTAAGQGEPALAALFARECVADLEVRWTMGRDTQEIDRRIESLGLVFQIATRKTSWVAVDEVKSVDPTRPSRTESVPQELPFGTNAAGFGLDGAMQVLAEADAEVKTMALGGAFAENVSPARRMTTTGAAPVPSGPPAARPAAGAPPPPAMRAAPPPPAPAPRAVPAPASAPPEQEARKKEKKAEVVRDEDSAMPPAPAAAPAPAPIAAPAPAEEPVLPVSQASVATPELVPRPWSAKGAPAPAPKRSPWLWLFLLLVILAILAWWLSR